MNRQFSRAWEALIEREKNSEYGMEIPPPVTPARTERYDPRLMMYLPTIPKHFTIGFIGADVPSIHFHPHVETPVFMIARHNEDTSADFDIKNIIIASQPKFGFNLKPNPKIKSIIEKRKPRKR